MSTYAVFRLGEPDTTNAERITRNVMWRELEIAGRQIRFLRDTLLATSDFRQCDAVDGVELWKLTFFKNQPYAIVIEVQISEHDDIFNANLKLIGKAIWLQLDNSSEAAYRGLTEIASQWLRGTGTLAATEFIPEGKRHVAVDAKGIAFLSEPVQETTFRRALILQALAYAYQTVMHGLSRDLIASLSNEATTRETYKKLVLFNAQCFFTSPVELSNVALPDIWRRLRVKFSIDETNAEITRQAADVSQLLAEQARGETRRQEKASHDLAVRAAEATKQEDIARNNADKKRDSFFRFWGRAAAIFLLLVSIMQGLQASPAQLFENLKLWKKLLS